MIFREPRGAACAGQSMQWRHRHRQPDQSRIRSIQTHQPRGLQVETRRVSSDFGLTAVRPRSLRGANSSGRTRSARRSVHVAFDEWFFRESSTLSVTTLPRITSGITTARPVSKSSGGATRLANCWHTKIYMTTWSRKRNRFEKAPGNEISCAWDFSQMKMVHGEKGGTGKMLIVPSDLSLNRGELKKGKFYLQFCV